MDMLQLSLAVTVTLATPEAGFGWSDMQGMNPVTALVSQSRDELKCVPTLHTSPYVMSIGIQLMHTFFVKAT